MTEQGSIFGIPLEKNIGFAYVQCIYTDSAGFIPSLMIKVLNYHSELLETSIEKLINCEELCYPFLMMGEPLLRGKNKWFKIGVASLNTEEHVIVPDLREPIGGTALIDNYDWENITWHVILNFNYRDPIKNVPYNSIKHLGLWRHSSNIAIREFLSMFWLKKLEIEIKTVYTDEEIFGEGNFWKRGAFYETENLVFHSDIPRKYWGKVITPSSERI